MRSAWLWLVFYALGYGITMLALDGIHLQENSPYHRYQAEALLRGQLYLSDNVHDLRPGLAWHDGKIQHVWGLGVGLWLLPFNTAWHLFSNEPCPDRLILGLAFALLAFYSAITSLRLIRQDNHALGLPLLWLIGLCPALWTLSRASQLVFEETVLYSIILSLGVLVSLVRVAVFHSNKDCFICCLLSAFTIWVRPTHFVYGLGAIGLASILIWQYQRHKTKIILGGLLTLCSLALLAWTNYTRFGSPVEFGHHLTVTTGNMIYLTRFGNPYHQASLWAAAKELFGLLFLARPQGAYAFANDMFPDQSPLTRWRRLDLSAFDLTYIMVILAAVVIAILCLIRQRKPASGSWQQPQTTLSLVLLLWSGFSTMSLALFYLYYPAIASRYLLDFAPAFTGFSLLFWSLQPKKWRKFSIPLLAVWLIGEITSSQVPVFTPEKPTASPSGFSQIKELPLNSFHGLYDLDHFPIKNGIPGNGYGWDADSGIAENVVSLALDDPQFVELLVSPRRSINGIKSGSDVYLAQIDGISLPLKSVTQLPEGIKISFEIPLIIKNQQQIQMLFLCFSTSYNANDRNSERFLYSLRWKNSD